MPTTPDRSHYLLLLRQPAGGTPPPDELHKIMARFAEWMDTMGAKGMVLSTNGLELSGKVLRGSRGLSITDGPYAEAKEVIGGYVLIAASNLEEAIEAARGCPGLDYHMAVEVRPIRLRAVHTG